MKHMRYAFVSEETGLDFSSDGKPNSKFPVGFFSCSVKWNSQNRTGFSSKDGAWWSRRQWLRLSSWNHVSELLTPSLSLDDCMSLRFSSVQFSHSVVSNSLQPHGLQHAGPPCPSPTPRVYSSSCPLSWWYHLVTSSSTIPFSSCLQSFPASGSFPMSQFFPSGGQSIGVSASASVLPMNIKDWFPLGWTSLISLQPKGLSRVFFNTTVQKHQFFGALLSLWCNSHIHIWLLEKP